MRRFGLRAGAVTACLLGLVTVAATMSAEATTTPPSPSALSSSPGNVAPDTLGAGSATATGQSQGPGCPEPASLLQMTCMLHFGHGKSARTFSRASSAATQDGTAASGLTISAALGPADLRAAYGLTTTSTTGGMGQTVAIVDAFGDPNIGSDLRNYQANWISRYGWSSSDACANASGLGTTAGCLTLFNQDGGTSLPAPGTGDNLSWQDETALDAEMVWAICPNCHIDLFEANSSSLPDLGTAENSAARVSDFVSNSWGGFGDFPGESVYDNMYFNHPGVAIDFASGDAGFGAAYPASSQLVTSVGGTYLENASDGTGYAEEVWDGQQSATVGTGAGCTSGEAKPSWQSDSGCQNRTENDVAAVADAPFWIDLYSSSGDCGPGWGYGGVPGAFASETKTDCGVYGTSVATPIITAIYALAGTPAANTYPVSYLYQHAGTADFNRVTSGRVGTCESNRAYVCNAASSLGNGYNGPAGLGTPNGTAAFQPAAGDIVSAVNPGTYDLTAGSRVSLPAIPALDSASGQLLYSASGLPSGLSVNQATGAISGKLPGNPVNDTVRVTVKEKAGTGASATISFGIVSVKPMNSDYHAGSGEVKLDLDGKCMNDGYNDTHVDAPISIYPCHVSASQDWSYSMPAGPGSAGRISVHGKCLYVLGKANSSGHHLLGLANCGNSPTLLWVLTGYAGAIVNLATGDCITDPNYSTRNNTQLTVEPCAGTTSQAWTMPASPVTSGVAGKCLSVSGGSAIATACGTSASQKVTLGLDGSLRIGGECLHSAGGGKNDGTAITELGCNSSPSEMWGFSAYGQIENLLSEKCLAIPGNSGANGAKLKLEDCYGQPGEVWAAS